MTERVTQERFFAIVPTGVIYDQTLNHTDIRVYATLSERAGKKRRAWPGVRRIATDIRMSPTTVQQAVARLETSGWVEIDRSDGRSNTYWLPMATVTNSDTPAAGDRDSNWHGPYQNLSHTVPESVTELDEGTRRRTTAAANFDAFHNQRVWAEVQRRKNAGADVRNERGLAHTIAKDEDFYAESQRIWSHRDCDACDATGYTHTYAPGSGSVRVVCDEGNQE